MVPLLILLQIILLVCLRLRKKNNRSITRTSNEIQNITKVINSLENGRILLKSTTKKITRQKRGLLNFLSPLFRFGLLLMKNVLITLAKSVLVPLGLTTPVSATNEAIQKNIFVSRTTLRISNEEINDIMLNS